MAYRLKLSSGPETLTYPLSLGENLLGSHPACEVSIEDPSISRHHAVLVVTPSRVEIADLGSENGTRVDGSKIADKWELQPGSRLTLGTAELILEALDDDDAEIALPIGGPIDEEVHSLPQSTASIAPLHRFTAQFLTPILRTIRDGASGTELADQVGSALFSCLPAIRVEIREGIGTQEAILYRAERGDQGEHPVILGDGGLILEVEFVHQGAGRLHQPLLEISRHLLELGERRRSAPTKRPNSVGEKPPWPRPQTLDPAMQDIYRKAEIVARGKVPVMIRGESGTGKELLARFLHDASPINRGPFVTLNCAALPRDLQEAELFGIEKGVATGVEARPGRFEDADGGTLFLDEIGDMAPETQAKILRVIQEGEVFRLGGRNPRPARARLVSATHRDLTTMREKGLFRDDLYHRIADWDLELPPLRRRRADIGNLAAFFAEREATDQGKKIRGISRRALRSLEAYSWPGNVRQLEREMARAVLFVAEGGLVDSGSLSEEILAAGAGGKKETLRGLLDRTEREAVAKALLLCGDDVAQAAEHLGIPTSTLYRKLKSYDPQE